MKIDITFKCPDAVDYALEDYDDEDKKNEAKEFIEKYVAYGEYIYITFDTVEKTVKVKSIK